MAKGDYLGEFEQIILLALLRLRDNAYGMTIRREILKRTGRQVSIGAVYATLERLERKGYVSSRQGDATPERGGRAKRFFKIDADGAAALKESQEQLSKMAYGLRPLLEAL
jgi:PadR family transcriptional regulator, regulatory protein PadR